MSDELTHEQIASLVAADEARRVHLPAGEPVQGFLARAQALIPTLNETAQVPLGRVEPVADSALPLRFSMRRIGDAAQLAQLRWNGGDQFIVDFGGHRTGYLSFRIEPVGGMADSPVRLKLTFGEVPTDVAEPFEPYTGWLSAAWLPEEIVTLDDLPTAFRLARRHAFRYVKFEIIATSKRFGVRVLDLLAHAVTAAEREPEPLPLSAPEWVRRVDAVAQATLRDCLQTTFEDGPRRDRRLWLGDLRLQALANYATFRADAVVERCLFLFAGLPRSDGLVNGCVYERPEPTYADTPVFDYAALFNVTLQEYVAATGKLDAGLALWPVALKQLEVLLAAVGSDHLFIDTGATWCFIDWAMPLDRSAAVQGVLIFALRRTLQLARAIGREADVAHYPALIDRMVGAARERLWDGARGIFVSGLQRQVSVASQAWMVLAGVAENDEQAAAAIRSSLASEDAVQPVTPYLYHYVAEALLACGARDEALEVIRRYWGSMVDAGADTFWETYDPKRPLHSPYGDIHSNSFCHAWSCTPTWFFRAAGLGFDERANAAHD